MPVADAVLARAMYSAATVGLPPPPPLGESGAPPPPPAAGGVVPPLGEPSGLVAPPMAGTLPAWGICSGGREPEEPKAGMAAERLPPTLMPPGAATWPWW